MSCFFAIVSFFADANNESEENISARRTKGTERNGTEMRERMKTLDLISKQ